MYKHRNVINNNIFLHIADIDNVTSVRTTVNNTRKYN